jgi:hypothetical protein
VNVLFRRLADNTNAGSMASGMRRRRLAVFETLLSGLPGPVRMLDVGGTESFWKMTSIPADERVRVTLLNMEHPEVTLPRFTGVEGDARRMSSFRDGEFDVVFSNSVLEHVGSPGDRRAMADEVRHFLFPLFQYLPVGLRAFLLEHFNLGWYGKTGNRDEARRIVGGIELVGRMELKSLFPEAVWHDEKVLGLTKSFTVYHGW